MIAVSGAAFASSTPSIAGAGELTVGLFWGRWILALTGDLALPHAQTVTINPKRSASLQIWNFAAGASLGHCWGGVLAACPGLTFGMRGLAVVPTGTLYQQKATLGFIPTLGLELAVRWRFASHWAIAARLSPFVPLGVTGAYVDGTITTITTGLVEGTLGLGLAWSPQFASF